MTLAEFNSCSQQQKADAVWEWGFYLCRFNEGAESRTLFLLENFFVELSLGENAVTQSIRGLAREEVSEDIRDMMRLHHPAFFQAVFNMAGRPLAQNNS